MARPGPSPPPTSSKWSALDPGWPPAAAYSTAKRAAPGHFQSKRHQSNNRHKASAQMQRSALASAAGARLRDPRINSDTQADPNLDLKRTKSESWFVRQESIREGLVRFCIFNVIFNEILKSEINFLVFVGIWRCHEVHSDPTRVFVRFMVLVGSGWSFLTPACRSF